MSETTTNDEDTILNNTSLVPVIESFTDDCALENLIDSLESLVNSTNINEELLQSDDYFQKLMKITMISGTTLIDRKIASIEYKKNNRYLKLINLYIWLLQIRENIDFKRAKPMPQLLFTYNQTTLNERKLEMLCQLAQTINFLFVSLIEMRVHAIQNGIIKELIKIISDVNFLNKMDEYNPHVVQLFAFNINWLSKIAEAYKETWHEYDSLSSLIKMSKLYPNLALYLYMASANIAYDKEIENFHEIQQALDKFVDLTNTCIQEDSSRSKQEFIDEEDNKTYEFDVIYTFDITNNATISITGLILSLYRLSVNNKIKFDLYHKPGLKESLKKLTYQG